MAPKIKSETAPSPEESRIVLALENRGLFTRGEYLQLRAQDGTLIQDLTPETFLGKLTAGGLLTPAQARRLAEDLPTLLNQPFPGYELLGKLGEGSMGEVYKARQLSMDRLVAIKVLKRNLATNKDFIQRFLREAHLAAKFSSNNVVQAIDAGAAGGRHFFVMEFVEGVTIKEELEKGKIYEEKEAVEIVLQIAQALDHAHRRNLIHRDIKPANIMLTPEGIAKLADLGLARETTDLVQAREEKGMTIGTGYYIAPEQVRSREDVDSRADIYSLGATLYHMVTGRPAFHYPNIKEVLRAHVQEELVPPDHRNPKLSSGLGEVVEFMMAKKRSRRYPSPEGLIHDLECLLRDEAPRLARQKIDTNMLKGLAEGEADEEETKEEKEEEEMVPIWWAYGLGGGLVVSLLLNLFLAVR